LGKIGDLMGLITGKSGCDIKDCEHCKTGKKQLDAYNSWKKEKKITYVKLVFILKDCGGRCVSCMYNNIKGRKAKAYSKIPKLNFQQLDMFEPIEGE
jgi:hypothetical protein